jgi:tRNA-specific 2-thiouridylase
MAQNTVTVGSEAALYSGGLLAGDMNWVSIPAPDAPLRCTAKIRYRQPEQPATLYPQGDGIRLCFDTPQRAITPGQAVVLYAGELVLGGGTIREALNG